MNAHVSLSDDAIAVARRAAADRARAHIITQAVILHDIGGMAAVLEGFQIATTAVGRARRDELTKAGWIV